MHANPLTFKPRQAYPVQSDEKSDVSANSETNSDEDTQCSHCGVGIPANEEQDHINANHPSEEEAITRSQHKKKKTRMYKSSTDSESEDNEMINQEVKKIARSVSVD